MNASPEKTYNVANVKSHEKYCADVDNLKPNLDIRLYVRKMAILVWVHLLLLSFVRPRVYPSVHTIFELFRHVRLSEPIRASCFR